MAAKKETVKKSVTKKAAPKTKKAEVVVAASAKPGSLSVPVLSLVGQSAGTLTLPKELFGAQVNKPLLAQAIWVYSTNQTAHFGSTKTRGEVNKTTAKIYRQKGTGGARHGSKAAPIYVGGGVTFAPKYRKTELDLPKKMRKAALVSALSVKVQEGMIFALADLEKATGKTKQMANLARRLEPGRSILIVDDKGNQKAQQAVRNLPKVDYLVASQLNAYEVIKHHSLVITKVAVERLEKGPEKQESKIESLESNEKKDLKPKKPTRKAAK